MRVEQIEYISQFMSEKKVDLTKSMIIKRSKKTTTPSKIQINRYLKL